MNKNDANNIVSLELDGDKISADKLRSSINKFFALADEIATQVVGEKKALNWIVSVKPGSIILESRPEPIGIKPVPIPKIINALGSGLAALEKSPHEAPPYFSKRALELAQDLASIPDIKGNGLNRILVRVNNKPHTLTRHTVANVDSLLGYHTKALGSIEGKLQTLSERRHLKIIIYDSLTDKSIICNIDEELRDQATEAFGKRVYAYGMIRYNKKGMPKSIKVEELKVFQGRDKLPSAKEVCGILAEV